MLPQLSHPWSVLLFMYVKTSVRGTICGAKRRIWSRRVPNSRLRVLISLEEFSNYIRPFWVLGENPLTTKTIV